MAGGGVSGVGDRTSVGLRPPGDATTYTVASARPWEDRTVGGRKTAEANRSLKRVQGRQVDPLSAADDADQTAQIESGQVGVGGVADRQFPEPRSWGRWARALVRASVAGSSRASFARERHPGSSGRAGTV